MKVFSQLKDLRLSSCILVVGNLDGFHLGHDHLLKQALKESFDKKLPLVVMSFKPHPKEFFNKDSFFNLFEAFTLKECLEKKFVDFWLIQNFDSHFSKKTAMQFVKDVKYFLNPHSLFAGKDFRFGCDRKGDISFLENSGLNVCVVDDFTDQSGQKISSSYLRSLVEKGDFETFSSLAFKDFSRKFKKHPLNKNLFFTETQFKAPLGLYLCEVNQQEFKVKIVQKKPILIEILDLKNFEAIEISFKKKLF